MESNRIQLEFSKTMANLVGDRFGRTTFGTQVKDKFDETKINVAVIPDRIEDVATSFIQGFYSSLSENKGKEYALKRLRYRMRHRGERFFPILKAKIFGGELDGIIGPVGFHIDP